MSLINISTRIFSRDFAPPRRRLLLTYLLIMITIFGASGISLYIFVNKSLKQQLNLELLTLVDAAAPSLKTIKTEGHHNLDRELSWRKLFSQQKYSLEWYDSQGKLLARRGDNFPSLPLLATISREKLNQDFPIFQRQDRLQTATISVYTDNPKQHNLTLEGYIRASESTQEIDVTLSKLRIGLELGGTTAIILISLSSIYLTHEALRPMKKGVQRLKQLTADISHHVRTPLTRINIATDILLSQTDKIQPYQVNKLNIISRAVEQIKSLLEELLFLVRIDITATFKELRFTRLSLNQLLQDLSEQFRPLAQAQAIDFQTQLNSNFVVKGDRYRLSRLFTNILENAFQYSNPGDRITLSTKLTHNIVTITIEDTGIGIAEEHLPYIFQDFWRSDLAISKEPEGFGLGLTIAQAIVQQHRGKIIVSSMAGVGSCIQVELCLA